MENLSQLWLLSWLRIVVAKSRSTYRELEQKLRLTSIKKSRCAKDAYIASSVQVLGWSRVQIGLGSVISDHTWINVNDRQANTNAVIVGSFCFIGRRNFLSSGDVIKIGDYCLTGPNCNFLGADHVYTSPLVPYIATGVTRGGSIEIGANCWLGADVTVLKNVKIGYGSIIGAGTVVNKNIPPLSVVVGNPGRVIKRFNLQQQAWISAKEYSDENDRNLMSEADYLEILNKTKINLRGYRVASSQSFGDL